MFEMICGGGGGGTGGGRVPLSVGASGAVRLAVPAQQAGSSRVSVLVVVMMLRFFLSTNLWCC